MPARVCYDLSTWEARLRCQTPAPCFISNAGMQDRAPGPRFHVCSYSCLTAGMRPWCVPGHIHGRRDAEVRGLGAGAFLLMKNPETLDLSLCPLPADLSKHTPIGHFLPKRICGDFSLSAALGEGKIQGLSGHPRLSLGPWGSKLNCLGAGQGRPGAPRRARGQALSSNTAERLDWCLCWEQS